MLLYLNSIQFIGFIYLPMLLIAPRIPVQGNVEHSSQNTLLLGFSIFGSEIGYSLNHNNKPVLPLTDRFFAKHSRKTGSKIGLSAQVLQQFVMELKYAGLNYDLSGWPCCMEVDRNRCARMPLVANLPMCMHLLFGVATRP